MKKFILLTMLVASAMVAQAQAATVLFTVEKTGAGTFDLYADVSLGDNGGLAGYSFTMTGIDTVQNLSPRAVVDYNTGAASGFTLLTSADDDPVVVGVQNSTAANTIVYGYGQVGGDYLPIGAFGAVQNPWAAHLLLASGTFSGPAGDLLASSTDGAPTNVWTAESAVSAFAADSSVAFVGFGAEPPEVPEPTSLVLLGLGLIGLVARRRR